MLGNPASVVTPTNVILFPSSTTNVLGP